jgi:hypothetical protein
MQQSEEITRQFELAKLDYSRLGAQEQALMNKRQEVWTKFFAILVILSGYAGIVGLHSAIYLLALVPFFIACISLEIKHDEKVLRYDVRKGMRKLADKWGFANHDSTFSEQNGKRWWQGYYKYGKASAFVVAELAATGIVWYVTPFPLSIVLAVVHLFFIVVTVWCMF